MIAFAFLMTVAIQPPGIAPTVNHAGNSPLVVSRRVGVTSPPALVRAWHRQFLHREPDPRDVSGWTYWFRLGRSRTQVLAAILSTDEYYRHAGATTEGFVQSLFADTGQGEHGQAELSRWLSRARGMSREGLAASFLAAHPEALEPDPGDAGQVVVGRRQSPGMQTVGSPRVARREEQDRTRQLAGAPGR
jgi:hypothetical protein